LTQNDSDKTIGYVSSVGLFRKPVLRRLPTLFFIDVADAPLPPRASRKKFQNLSNDLTAGGRFGRSPRKLIVNSFGTPIRRIE
jgi:hypothetical protein